MGSRLLLAATLGRKKKKEEKERAEKETEDMMWEDQVACWLENKMEKRTGMKLKKRMLDWGGCVYEWVGPGDTCLPYRPGDKENVGEEQEERNLRKQKCTSFLQRVQKHPVH